MHEPYDVDDRGDRAQFYYVDADGVIGDIAATLNREGGETADQHEWDGGPDVTAWAIAHDYPEVATARKV